APPPRPVSPRPRPAAAPPEAPPVPAPRPAARPPQRAAPRPPAEPRLVARHEAHRRKAAAPRRENPLSLPLVMVVLSVVISAGTAIAFAR
ncbi:hypothetical protein ACSNOI_24370, partial [Actinomadura kijaniata]|uniref:hypothetical protein n=1 Tax=Actinomadura kijaniata TaxID=46161 RepID=UPI003F1BD6FB